MSIKTVYQATDGSVHPTRAAAATHQKELDKKAFQAKHRASFDRAFDKLIGLEDPKSGELDGGTVSHIASVIFKDVNGFCNKIQSVFKKPRATKQTTGNQPSKPGTKA